MVTIHGGPSHTQNKSSSITSNDVMTRSYRGALSTIGAMGEHVNHSMHAPLLGDSKFDIFRSHGGELDLYPGSAQLSIILQASDRKLGDAWVRG